MALGIAFLAGVGVDARAVARLSAEAEAAGFSEIGVIEFEYDSAVVCQAILETTTAARVGSVVMRAYARHPMLVAETAAAIDALYPGRYAIGLGTGPTPRGARTGGRWGMSWDRSVGRMDEYLAVLRRALTGDAVRFDGEFYALDGVQMTWSPSNKAVPIWLAAGGPLMARLAGRHADRLFLHWANRPLAESLAGEAREACAAAGRSSDAVAVGNQIMTCVSVDRDSARHAMRAYLVGWYLHLERYQRLLAESGWSDVANGLARLQLQANWGEPREILMDPRAAAAVSLMPDALLDEFTLAGSPEECRERLGQFIEWGVDSPLLSPLPADGDWSSGYRAAIAAFASDHNPIEMPQAN